MNAPLRVLIVDDEPVARKVLREELDEIANIEVAGEAASSEQAIEQIHRLEPDLVFLDLQMPGGSGFDVIWNLDSPHPPLFVVVSAYDQHAVKAFEAGAIDYLLKPVGQDRLAQCLTRVRELRPASSESRQRLDKLRELARQSAPSRQRKIVGKAGEEFHLLDLQQVLAFQAERDLVWIVTRKQRYLATLNLKTIQEKLSGLTFARIHRNALVNLDHVAKMAPLSSQRWLVTLNNMQEFVVSKRQARQVQQLLRW